MNPGLPALVSQKFLGVSGATCIGLVGMAGHIFPSSPPLLQFVGLRLSAEYPGGCSGKQGKPDVGIVSRNFLEEAVNYVSKDDSVGANYVETKIMVLANNLFSVNCLIRKEGIFNLE